MKDFSNHFALMKSSVHPLGDVLTLLNCFRVSITDKREYNVCTQCQDDFQTIPDKMMTLETQSQV
jgi:hypothetical protein